MNKTEWSSRSLELDSFQFDKEIDKSSNVIFSPVKEANARLKQLENNVKTMERLIGQLKKIPQDNSCSSASKDPKGSETLREKINREAATRKEKRETKVNNLRTLMIKERAGKNQFGSS